MTAQKPNAELARGPWRAVIHYRGECYPDVRTALIELGQDGEVRIGVRRASALPDDEDMAYMPSSYATGDVAYELDDVYLVDDGDPSVAAEARFAQAQAMAAGLNDAFKVYGTGCRCDYLGEGTPEHAPSALCRSLRPDADRDEMQPPPCADHQVNELSCPVCSAQRRAFYAALGRDEADEDPEPWHCPRCQMPNAKGPSGLCVMCNAEVQS